MLLSNIVRRQTPHYMGALAVEPVSQQKDFEERAETFRSTSATIQASLPTKNTNYFPLEAPVMQSSEPEARHQLISSVIPPIDLEDEKFICPLPLPTSLLPTTPD